MKTPTIYIRLTDSLKRDVEHMAKADKLSVNQWIIRQLEGIAKADREYRADKVKVHVLGTAPLIVN